MSSINKEGVPVMKCDISRQYHNRFPFVGKFLIPFLVLLLFTPATLLGLDDNSLNSDGVELKKLLKQAERFVRQGNLREAENIYKRLVERDADSSEAKLGLAFVYLKQRRIVEAYDISFPIAKAEPKNSYALAVLGSVFVSAGRFSDARPLFYAAIAMNRREALAWAGCGMLDYYENQIDESLANIREAVFLAPNEPDYIFSLAQISARAEMYKEAADAYSRYMHVSRNTDDERRARIKGLINFLRFLGHRTSLYSTAGATRTVVPFELTGNRPVIELKINNHDRPLRFVLDTGSGISVLSEETAKRLKISSVSRGGHAKGIGGDGRFEIVYGFLRQVSVGDIRVRNVPVYIRKFHASANEMDGYIGLSLISKFITTIDYGDLTFSLAKRDDRAQMPIAGDSVPLRLTSSGFLSGEVRLAGVDAPMNFIVDTGASVSVISDEVAGLDPVISGLRNERMRVIGAAGIAENVPSFLLPKVSFGSNSSEGIMAVALDLDMINEASGFVQAGILGGNFLRNYRLTFDFKNSSVIFQPVAAAQPTFPNE
jgi:tetratricopeptide (TPR) repeat protein